MKILNNLFFILFYAFCCHTNYAQTEPIHTEYDWEINPQYEVTNKDAEIVALKDKIITEFLFQGEEGLVEYFIEHRILWLNSDQEIEEYNKVYLPYSSNSELIRNKARVITPSNEIIELDNSKIFTAQDEEKGTSYKYYAFEGIEKGSIIEYYYIIRRYPKYQGNLVKLQSYFPKQKVEFDLYSPSNLIFKFKSYNETPKVVEDTLSVDRNHWSLALSDVDLLPEEEMAAYEASKKHVIYKLDENTANNKKNITSFSRVAKNIYNYYYSENDSKTAKLIAQFLEESKANIDDKESGLRELDNYIKTNVYFSEDLGDEALKDLNAILTNKIANETGLTKLYVNLIKALDIDHEFVLTSNREKLRFDNDFEAHNFLTDILIYFPDFDTYLSPENKESRYGFPPYLLTDNYGLFIKEINVGNYKSAVGQIKYIEPIKAEKSYDKMVIDIKFDPTDLSECIVQFEESIAGYKAVDIQPYIHMISEEDLNEFTESMAKEISGEAKVLNMELLNNEKNLFGIKPLVFKINFTTNGFVEKAGSKYLFKLGELIGPQMELYQEKKRTLAVENQYNRHYFRTLNIEIPKGYKVVNLEDIIIDKSYVENDEDILSFKSNYVLNNNRLEITANEFYKRISIAPEIYEEYRKVINSAADFNKVTLIIEPE